MGCVFFSASVPSGVLKAKVCFAEWQEQASSWHTVIQQIKAIISFHKPIFFFLLIKFRHSSYICGSQILLFDLGISQSSHLQYGLYFADFSTKARRQLISSKSQPLTLNVIAVVKCSCRFPEEHKEPVLQCDSASKCDYKTNGILTFPFCFLSMACRSKMSQLASGKKRVFCCYFQELTHSVKTCGYTITEV